MPGAEARPAMELMRHPAPGTGAAGTLLVMLPGVGFEAADFAAHGLVAAAQETASLDIVAARPDLDLYLDQTIAAEIERTIVAPARSEGVARIWFLGISLGGMGALLHARAYPGGADGLILLSPFLGTPGLIAEAAAAGGLAAWQPGAVAANDGERQALAWLKHHVAAPSPRPEIYLGYGRTDRFARGHALLAERLPPARIVLGEGGHDWETWALLWRRILALRPFAEGGR
jgi:pimeloyl-ACP methyl ester carboxylesterase